MIPAIVMLVAGAIIIGGYGYIVHIGLKYQKESEQIRAENRARKKAKKEKKRLAAEALAATQSVTLNN
jgi:hypothetical protein